jgi:hypothetical protein
MLEKVLFLSLCSLFLIGVLDASPITIPFTPEGELDKVIPEYFGSKKTPKQYHKLSPNQSYGVLELDLNYQESCNINFELQWTVQTDSAIYSTPVIFPNGDSSDLKNIFLTSYFNYVESIQGDGRRPPGWPLSFEGSVFQSSPLIYDIDNDGNTDIGVVDQQANLYWIRTGDYGTYLQDYHIQVPALKILKNWYEIAKTETGEINSYIMISLFDRYQADDIDYEKRNEGDWFRPSSSPFQFSRSFNSHSNNKNKNNAIKHAKLDPLSAATLTSIEKLKKSKKLLDPNRQQENKIIEDIVHKQGGSSGSGSNSNSNSNSDAIHLPSMIMNRQQPRRRLQEVISEEGGGGGGGGGGSETDPGAVAAETMPEGEGGEGTGGEGDFIDEYSDMEALEIDHGEDGGDLFTSGDGYLDTLPLQEALRDGGISSQDSPTVGDSSGEGILTPPSMDDDTISHSIRDAGALPIYAYGIGGGGNVARGADDGISYYMMRHYAFQRQQLLDGEDGEEGGNGKYINIDPHVLATPAMADINGDGHMEIIFPVSYYLEDSDELRLLQPSIDRSMYIASALMCFDMQAQEWTWTIHLDLTTSKSK